MTARRSFPDGRAEPPNPRRSFAKPWLTQQKPKASVFSPFVASMVSLCNQNLKEQKKKKAIWTI
jgi:hypothetical protein